MKYTEDEDTKDEFLHKQRELRNTQEQEQIGHKDRHSLQKLSEMTKRGLSAHAITDQSQNENWQK